MGLPALPKGQSDGGWGECGIFFQLRTALYWQKSKQSSLKFTGDTVRYNIPTPKGKKQDRYSAQKPRDQNYGCLG